MMAPNANKVYSQYEAQYLAMKHKEERKVFYECPCKETANRKKAFHHPDYSKPLCGMLLCTLCHTSIHGSPGDFHKSWSVHGFLKTREHFPEYDPKFKLKKTADPMQVLDDVEAFEEEIEAQIHVDWNLLCNGF